MNAVHVLPRYRSPAPTWRITLTSLADQLPPQARGKILCEGSTLL
jgi:hypothetical protein